LHLVVEALLSELDCQILFGKEVHDRFHHIWKMEEPLQALAVALPTSTEEVSFIMKVCHKYDQKVVVHGGLTNLVGSTETEGDEVVISMERMNSIEEVDKSSRTLTTQSGVILENIHIAAKENGLLFPLSFGAKGSAQIGGVISTNAGGLRVFRYGMTRALVLGLEAVLADGTIISSMKKIIKDNSAYDLKQLFVGSEGTLGIVTRAVLKLVEAPKRRTTAFVAFDEFERVVEFLKYMDGGLSGTLSGYELIWGDTYKVMTSPPAISKPPIPHGHKYYVLVEGLGSEQEMDQSRMQSLLEDAMVSGLIDDGTLSQSESDLEWFWKIREDVHVLSSKCNNDQHFDISLPIPLIGKVIDDILIELLKVDGVEEAYPFGHIGDGNIHLTVGKRDTSQQLTNAINDVIYSPLKAIGGSVSAEHGIGLHKKRYLHLCRTETEISLMKTLKQALDPKGLLNRGKVLD